MLKFLTFLISTKKKTFFLLIYSLCLHQQFDVEREPRHVHRELPFVDPWICEPHHSPSPDDGGADALLPNEADGEHAHLGGPADLVEESGKKNEVF